MRKKYIITIAGKPGSGKSVSSKQLASLLGYQHFSSGDLFRAIGKEHGIDDVREINLAAERGELDVDELVDQRLRDIGSTEGDIVIDSRTAWHWIPESFKVYLDLDLETAAKRILKGIDSFRMEHEHIPNDPNEYALLLEERLASESRRYKKLYDVDPYDTSNYDLVVDTSTNTVEQVVSNILKNYKEWLSS
jgi:cytidylate kinase